MDKQVGGPLDEWVYLTPQGYQGPITKAQLAFYLEMGKLPSQCLVRHVAPPCSQQPPRNLGKIVERFRADCLRDHGQWGHDELSVLH